MNDSRMRVVDADESGKIRERLLRFERESRYLRRDSDERKVLEEVFDRSTMLAVEELIARKDLGELHGVVRAGKEARVYLGEDRAGGAVAVKIYLMSASDFRKRMGYIAGDRRFGKLPAGSRETIYLWTRKEFKNLQLAQGAGVRVPTPVSFLKNILIMEYIGTPPDPAPTFSEAEVGEEEYRWTFKTIGALWKGAGLVHADLSEFNVFKTGGGPVLFDMGSAVLSSHPQAQGFLKRDVSNMVRFFRKRGIGETEADEWMKEISR
ncbi:MAG: serine protein kinase RIO [Nitrososphaerota archaeon]|nr:serine protein kinase RIO [Nitrososphaerota archaeon]MDG6941113.1 serine protein kinase RIO [Nitrososphaerota archaeon]MDG6945716.1 serine protein kinase RIO [Nitrososphaerota archaeon]MDG6958244.1 serine protein kinase RIO [Nitrososphaerota archaeon]MDG6970946.1 serine protein kinase RIO [Nitrososphaerota archaeon]